MKVAVSPQLYMGRCPIKNHSRPFLWKRGERSEAGLVSPHVKIPLHAANLRPFQRKEEEKWSALTGN